jgi:predicted Zn-dependent peptidase
MPHTRSVGVAILAGIGSRYERKDERGISHFIEHMMFKGTPRRPTAQHISEEIEGLGGVINASTDSEVTRYWAKVAHHHLPVALDVLVDMLLHSKFEPTDVEKEREVITQEICRMMDMPESRVHSLVGMLLWPDHPVGWDTAGTTESVSGISREDLLDYVRRGYAPGGTVVSLAGNLDEDGVIHQMRDQLGRWESTPKPAFAPASEPVDGPSWRVEFKETEQAHLCLGLHGLPADHPDRFTMRILNVILGEGMSSRLFLEIRERRGLAYSVGSYTSSLRDTGAMVLYAGVPPQKVSDAVSAMVEQLDLMRANRVPEGEMVKAKEFAKGRILLRMEDTIANAGWFGQQEVTDQPVLTVDQVVENLDAVTVGDVQELAQKLFQEESLRLAIIGPFKDDGAFSARLRM